MASAIKKMESMMRKEDVKKARENAQKEIFALQLAQLREDLQLKQTEVSNFSQPSVSKIEKRKDIKISTLIEYVKSLGMKLEIKAYSENSDYNKVILSV